jgi:hypothetical protein
MAKMGTRARQRRKKELVFGSILILIVISILSGVVYYSVTKPKGINSETLCPAEGPLGHFVLLVDRTDPLNFTQKQAFSITLKELVETRVPAGYLLSVFALGEDFKETALPLVEICNPGDGTGESALTSNLPKLRKQYQSKFTEPIQKLLESLVARQSAKWSPIFEMMQLVGINGYRKHAVKGPRRLIVVSDMLQNSPQFSMYQGPVDYATFANSDYGKKAQAELSDVSVELHYLMNRPQLQTKRNLKFWEDYFNKAGARIVEVRPIEG